VIIPHPQKQNDEMRKRATLFRRKLKPMFTCRYKSTPRLIESGDRMDALLANGTGFSKVVKRPMNHDVLIVGAGLAGLCCVGRLQQEGVRCLLLDASVCIGGRIRHSEI
jgi:hypothetical protein